MKRYVMCCYGEVIQGNSLEVLMAEARNHVHQYICDFLRPLMPLKVTEEVVHRFDVEVHQLDDNSKVSLPFQQWADDYYIDSKRWKKDEEEREYERFVELYEKYKDRLPKDKV